MRNTESKNILAELLAQQPRYRIGSGQRNENTHGLLNPEICGQRTLILLKELECEELWGKINPNVQTRFWGLGFRT
jgi:hypothetical protein